MLWENSSVVAVVVVVVAVAVAHPGLGGEVGEFEGAEPPQDSQGGFGGGEAPPNTLPGFGVRPGFGARPGLPMNISEIAHEYIRNCFPRNQITKMRLKRIFVI